MARPIHVLLLIFTLFVSGCGSPNGFTRVWDRWSDRSEHASLNWLDQHPVVRGALVGLAIGAVVAAGVVLYVLAHNHSDDD